MFCKGRIVVLLTVVCFFLFAGISYAWVVKIVQPNGGETLTSGSVYHVKIKLNNDQIPSNVHLSKYKLSLSCIGPDFKDELGERIWNLIANRTCGLFYCPTDYAWEVSNVNTKKRPVRECKLMVELFNTSGNRLGSDTSNDWFTVLPYGGVVPAQCGNGILETPTEQCDDGNLVNCDGCSNQCTNELNVCGNGKLELCEECDDGNLLNGDGCSSSCTIEP